MMMRNSFGNKKLGFPFLLGLLVFMLVFVITSFVTYQRFIILKNSQEDEVRRQALRVESELKSVLAQGYSSTQSLAFIVEDYGIPEDFPKTSRLILKTNDYVDALELVDSTGVITHVYPYEGNEVLGFNILTDSIGKPGALKTIEKGDYFISGPIDLKQGGSGFVCRTPIYKNNRFAGFAAAVIKLSTLLTEIPLDTIGNGPFSYQLSKINPDGSEVIFYSPKEELPKNALKHPITDYNGEWKLQVISNENHALFGLYIMGGLGLFLAGLAGFFTMYLIKQPQRLKAMVAEKTLLLKENEQKLKTYIDQASDGIFVTDFKGNVLDANIRGVEMFGYSKEELFQKNLSNLATEDDLKKVPIRFSELKLGQAILTERELIKKDKTTFYGEVSAKKLNDGTILGIVRDVTARKKLELAAWDNLQKFQKAFNSRTIGMAIFNEDLKFEDANPYFLEMIGVSLKDILGKTFEELGPIMIDEREKRKDAVEALEKDGMILSMELVLKPKDKGTLYVTATAENYVVDGKKFILATYLDRTEEKKALETIKASEKKYRELTERISDAFVSLDTQWNLTYVNAKGQELIGKTKEELTGKNAWEVFPSLLGSNTHEKLKYAIDKQKYVYLEQYHSNFDVWIESHVYPSPEGLTIYFRDITKKKMAEQENRKLLTVVEKSPGFIGLSSLEGNSIYLNENGRKLVGLTNEDSINNLSLLDFFPENARELVKEEYLPLILENGSWSGEGYLKSFNSDRYIPAALSAFIIKDENTQKPIGIGSVAFDLTERKKTEKELLELQSKMDAAIRIGKIGYWNWNVETGIIDWSDRMYEIYDVEPGTQIDVTLAAQLIHPEDLDEHNKIVEKKISQRDNSSFTYRIKHRDGTVKHVLVQMEVITNEINGDVTYQGTAIDVTERKVFEEQLAKQNQELKKTNSELDSFVYSASHELRAPLTSLLGLVDIMKREEQRKEGLLKLKMMENSITRLDEFIGDIVQYSRNKHVEVSPEKINFSTLINKALDDLWYLENTQGIQLIKIIEEEVDFYSDKRRVMVLLNNFISNAIKYHDMKKSTPTIWVNIKTSSEKAIIKIEDNGTGIAKEHQEKIYDMFFRASSKVTGSGIGLFIVKEVLSKLKGTITLESTPQKGSIFVVELPNLQPKD